MANKFYLIFQNMTPFEIHVQRKKTKQKKPPKNKKKQTKQTENSRLRSNESIHEEWRKNTTSFMTPCSFEQFKRARKLEAMKRARLLAMYSTNVNLTSGNLKVIYRANINLTSSNLERMYWVNVNPTSSSLEAIYRANVNSTSGSLKAM